MAFCEVSQVTFIVVKGAVLPEPEDDADPFKGQSAHGSVMRFSSAQEVLIIGFGPSAVRNRTTSKFVKGLAKELRATPAPPDFFALTAPIQYRSNTAFFLHLAGVSQGATI